MRTRVVFFGSPRFAVPSLQALRAATYDIAAVVTQPDRPSGRGGRLTPPEVKVAAQALSIPVLQPLTLKDEAVRAELRCLQADLFVVAAYGKILAQAVLDIPARGCVNVHASLLPRWRGASPISAAILAGDRETGVSVMEMAFALDAGPVISQRATPILPGDTTGALECRLAQLGAELLAETLPGWLDGGLAAQPQDAVATTYCTQIKKEDGWLAASMTAAEAERAVRAYDPWPGAHVVYNGVRLAVRRAEVVAGKGLPGTVGRAGNVPAIAFREGLLALLEVQRPGGKPITGAQFLAGERGLLAPAVGLA